MKTSDLRAKDAAGLEKEVSDLLKAHFGLRMPAGVKVACPSQTEIVISGFDRQAVGQVAAEVRALRPPEPYKGKGIRYSDEKVTIKETKKK